MILGPLNKGEDSLLLRDVIHCYSCNWDAISFSFPKNLLLKIKAMPFLMSTSCPDHISWSSSPSGSSELKEAYRLANVANEPILGSSISGEWIWKVQTLPKVRCFIWQC